MEAQSGGPIQSTESHEAVVPAATGAARDAARVPHGSAGRGIAATAEAPVGSANGAARPGLSPGTRGPGERQPATGPIDWLMSNLLRRLAWSKLYEPRIAIPSSVVGRWPGLGAGATATNQ